MAHILLVDDQSSMRLTLTALLKQAGHTLAQAATGEDALKKIQSADFDVVVTDLKLDVISGMDILRAAKANNPMTEVIVLTGYSSVETAVEAMKLGARDYLTKPVNGEELKIAVSGAMERQRLKSEVTRLRAAVEQPFKPGSIVATSPEMKEVLEMVQRVAPTDATVLIQGESGTGKELVARAIHQNSNRRDAPFIPINCGALPENLLESELFGHVKGAFTGAIGAKKGLFEEADGGTLFLDEIGETTPTTQVKLLRVLQDGEVRRVGSNTGVKTDVRIIAATNQRLQTRIRQGDFREDLYYRLQVILLNLPPLRERKGEVLPLVQHYLHMYTQKMNKPDLNLSADAEKALIEYPWPGNVRELANVVERAVILCRGNEVRSEDFALSTGGTMLADAVRAGDQARATADGRSAAPAPSNNFGGGESRSLSDVEREFIESALVRHNWERDLVASEIGLSVSALSKKIKEHNLEP
ncbi:MAG TPA: sigma-54 dependent transcriptional regulator [Abditibacteriaceae bacterium]|jgi:DNA-binding NtrC family response regulator